MTSILEKLVGVMAPMYCLGCSKENNVLCEACRNSMANVADSLCAMCGRPTWEFSTCAPCSNRAPLTRVWVAANYEGAVAEAIKLYKFGRARAASKDLAALIAHTLPYGLDATIVPVPTAPARIRQRGFDHTRLLAAELHKATGLKKAAWLNRASNVRQLGATRAVRLSQLEGAFFVQQKLNGQKILLLDDVVTTGATLQAAAQALKSAGAGEIVAAVVARRDTR